LLVVLFKRLWHFFDPLLRVGDPKIVKERQWS
jgi:hypothetical protein